MKHVIGFAYDIMDSQVKAQIVRDLLILSGQWDLVVNDPKGAIDPDLLQQLHLELSDDKPEIVIVYKTGDEWPAVENSSAKEVRRNLTFEGKGVRLDGTGQVGYYLKPLGRDGPALTERYLNRQHPVGVAIMNPAIRSILGF